MNVPWKVTHFIRENGEWKWQGFQDEIQDDAAMMKLAKTLEARSEQDPEFGAFLIDLNNLDEVYEDSDEDDEDTEHEDAVYELAVLRGWLDEVVQIDKITVEEEFSEYRKRIDREAAGEGDDPGVDTSEEHVREGR